MRLFIVCSASVIIGCLILIASVGASLPPLQELQRPDNPYLRNERNRVEAVLLKVCRVVYKDRDRSSEAWAACREYLAEDYPKNMGW